jgi:hypothetical protein
MCKAMHPILRLHMFEPMPDWTITKIRCTTYKWNFACINPLVLYIQSILVLLCPHILCDVCVL